MWSECCRVKLDVFVLAAHGGGEKKKGQSITERDEETLVSKSVLVLFCFFGHYRDVIMSHVSLCSQSNSTFFF